MSFEDDLEIDAMRLHMAAFHLQQLSDSFRRIVGRSLAALEIAEDAITDDERAAIEQEVICRAVRKARDETFSAAREILPNAIEEAIKLILLHIAESQKSGRVMLDVKDAGAAMAQER